jgi:hypothetical protein
MPLFPSFGNPYVDMWMIGIPFAFVLNSEIACSTEVWEWIRRDFPVTHEWDGDFCRHLGMIIGALGSLLWPLLLFFFLADWFRRRPRRDDDDDDQNGPPAGSPNVKSER